MGVVSGSREGKSQTRGSGESSGIHVNGGIIVSGVGAVGVVGTLESVGDVGSEGAKGAVGSVGRWE